MKQAILITAYKNINQLLSLVKTFDAYFNIYIHLDKKSNFSKKEIESLKNIKTVQYVATKYKVNWGGLNHLKAILHLSEKALLNNKNIFFHLITGEDFPIKKTTHFKSLTAKNLQNNYIEFFSLPTKNWHHGGMDRVEQYNFYDFFNAKNIIGKQVIHLFKKIQFRLNFKRKQNFNLPLFGGATYWSLSKNVLQYVVHFTQTNPNFFKKFRFTFCPEEIYFQTIILNSKHASKITNQSLRYVDWTTKRGGNPAYLDENDFKTIINSKSLFARKVDATRNQLFNLLTEYLKKKN